jgi:hypothetical protein
MKGLLMTGRAISCWKYGEQDQQGLECEPIRVHVKNSLESN